jgi:hypothetical protein
MHVTNRVASKHVLASLVPSFLFTDMTNMTKVKTYVTCVPRPRESQNIIFGQRHVISQICNLYNFNSSTLEVISLIPPPFNLLKMVCCPGTNLTTNFLTWCASSLPNSRCASEMQSSQKIPVRERNQRTRHGRNNC